MRIYNFSIFAPQTKYKSLKEIAVHYCPDKIRNM